MDKVKKFDEELKIIYKDNVFFQKVLSILFFGLSILIMSIPFELEDGFWIYLLQRNYMSALGVIQYMQVYMTVTENNKRVSIYKRLADMPVTKAEIRKVRYGYLNRICWRMGAAMIAVHQISSLLNHSFGMASVLYAASCAAFMWGVGMIYVCAV